METELVTIRQATLVDAGVIAQFNIRMAAETEGLTLAESVINAGVRNLIQHPDYGFYLVAEKSALVVGSLMITFEWSDWRNGLFWWIQSVYVRPEFRRLGIYRQLYEYVKIQAHQQTGICGFRLYVAAENKNAQDAYRKLGMHETHYHFFEELMATSALNFERPD